MREEWTLDTKRKLLLQLEPDESAIGKGFILCHSATLNLVMVDTHSDTSSLDTPSACLASTAFRHARLHIHICVFTFMCVGSALNDSFFDGVMTTTIYNIARP